jgi:hypothetical protein
VRAAIFRVIAALGLATAQPERAMPEQEQAIAPQEVVV